MRMGLSRRWEVRRCIGVALLMGACGWTDATAQTPVVSTPAPATELADAAAPAASDLAVLDRIVGLHLTRVPLQAALDTISAESGVRIAYGARGVPLEQLVTIVIDRVTVGDALRAVLDGTGVGLAVLPGGMIVLRPGNVPLLGSDRRFQGTATISGYVRDSATGASIPQVTIRVDGTTLGTKSDGEGRYKIAGVSAGEYRVTARRVGYLAKTRSVTVADGQAVTIDFLLNPPASKLDEVVTTAVGEQRRYQVGNVISTINVDSLAPTAPVTSVSDILAGRVPGLDVVEQGGLVGAGTAIRIRGDNTITLSNDPIIIVDGIRVDNTPGGTFDPLLSGGGGKIFSPNRLDDIDFTQIQSIDVLKGPAAATEYGTDASNGVIVITTKHGAAGGPQWHASAEQDNLEVPRNFPEQYFSWGHATNGTGQAIAGSGCNIATPGAEYYGTSLPPASVDGGCVVDSVTAFDAENDPYTAMLRPSGGSKYDLSVSGGADAIRYYVAGNVSSTVGNTQVPPAFLPIGEALGFPLSVLTSANTEQQRSLRANSFIRLGTTADLTVNVAYMGTFANEPSPNFLRYDGLTSSGPELPDSAYSFGYGGHGRLGIGTPLGALAGGAESHNSTGLTGGMTANWRPWSWLVTHATVGVDHGTQQENSEFSSLEEILTCYGYRAVNGQDPYGCAQQGSLSQAQGVNDVYSGDLRGTATLAITPVLRSVTSIGLQVADIRSTSLAAAAKNINTYVQTLGTATASVTPQASQAATLGGYVEEQLGFHDRFFLTGAVRVDAGSGFYDGTYTYATYPKLSASWLAVNTTTASLRLRGAFGANGQQPPDGSAEQVYTNGPFWLNGQVTAGDYLQSPGNSGLLPERSQEWEGGADLGLWNNRLTLEVTGYSKRTTNALEVANLGFDFSDMPYEFNLGTITNSGLEVALTGRLVGTRQLTWDVGVNASLNHNELLAINSSALVFTNQNLSAVQGQDRPGYPLNAYWAPMLSSYADLNHDGILEYPQEIGTGDSVSYVGPTLRTRTLSVTTHLGVLRNALSLGALFDYQGGNYLLNENAWTGAINGNLASENALSQAPLWEQARNSILENEDGADVSGFFEPADFVRFRELSLTYAVPLRVVRTLHVHAVSMTGAVRNLALWTRYTGPDPEVSAPVTGADNYGIPGSLGVAGYNDLREDGVGSIPLPRQWFVRLNLGF